jgi:hypothetical protein
MATRYNYDAERPQDYVIQETRNRADDQWLLAANRSGPFPAPWRDASQISDKIDLPPRVIRLLLQSGSAVSRDDRTMTWTLNFPEAEPLRPGTIVHWSDLTIDNQGAQEWIEVGLSGLRTTALNTTTNEQYTFVSGGNFPAAPPAKFIQLGGSTPVCATLLELDVLNSGRITIHNKNPFQFWDIGTDLRTTLVFIEPGAQVY